ncbi:OmpA family protein [Ferrimonas senticii]|uniref:OmpA family protein n=1 Tax=Ferrimonas senticii TaxID=394566 RepID=UPI00040159A0|nr:OmpA family protein [Ferrimonas senticii]
MKPLLLGSLLLLGGCQSWPQEGGSDGAKASLPWDGYLQSPAHLQEYQVTRQRVASAQHSLELLKLRGSVACMPERTYQAEQLLGLVRQEIAADLLVDASEHLLLLDNQLYRLSVRLTEMQRRLGCGQLLSSQTNDPLLQSLLEPEQFALDRDQLLPVFEQRLQRLAEHLQAAPELKLIVIGHADPQGSQQHNQQMGLRRAQQVVAKLQQFGVPALQLQAQSAGDSHSYRASQPQLETRTALLASRRVEFRLALIDAPLTPLPQSQWSRLQWGQ